MDEKMNQPSKKLVAVSHCILNQNAVIHGWERASGAFPFALELLKQGVAMIQLPCPEFITLGANRPPMTYEEYAQIPNYRKICRDLLLPILQQIQAYQQEGYEYLGIIGINESPNCSITDQRGVLMEEFFSLCEVFAVSSDFFEVPVWYSEDHQENMTGLLAQFMERG
ncbi:CD3072 family TudS-related putative desulfidase [Enterococcus sp. AZ072]|uniref:CD3072 family TudS-related putative desulfidase n=1 Tax=unclassified Enterococcus TaxID=2608891 RepID=UPI003D29D2C6